jgi:hypothetical protein
VHDWILASYEAEKSEGQPQPLDPPAAGRPVGLEFVRGIGR